MKTYSFDAVIFDLDGVITQTASVHSTAWTEMFNEYLKHRESQYGEAFKAFTHEGDYLPYVDGKPRYKGVDSFLKSRGINLSWGSPDDSPDKETVCGLGNRKNSKFKAILERDGAKVFESSVQLIKQLKANDIRIGVASSSKNCKPILERANLLHYFETRVDGVVSAELGLQGKPEPDIFTTACDNLGVSYHRAIVVEDAVSGVQAGRKGNFGLTLGVAREDNHQQLFINGADVVVSDLGELGGIEGLEDWFQEGLKRDQWRITYHDYAPERESIREALLSIGNGYFGTRGAHPESRSNGTNYPGTYIAGVYNRLLSKVAGRDIENEDFVNVPNWLPVTFRIDGGEWLDTNKCKILKTKTTLDFDSGLLTRDMTVEDDNGRQTQVISQRVASMANRHRAAQQYQIKPLNYSGLITIRSGLDGDHINDGVKRYSSLRQQHLKADLQTAKDLTNQLVCRTTQSDIEIAMASRLTISIDAQGLTPNEVRHDLKPAQSYSEVDLQVETGQLVNIDKVVAIYTSQDSDLEDLTPLAAAQDNLEHTPGFSAVLEASSNKWAEHWQKFDIKVEGDRLSQKLLRMHIYHLLCTASHHNAEIDAGIPARGLNGESYRGHIFWDELYILPMYYLNMPEVARASLMYRYRRLDKAREYARQHQYAGAMFPWQSGSDGREETQVVHLNPVSGQWGDDYSSLQRHINIALAYNIWQYIHHTDDREFLSDYGAEMYLDICHFWSSKCYKPANSDRYSIKNVMGPDEFHEKLPDSKEGGLKDNAYTNIMVVWLLKKAFDLLSILPESRQQELLGDVLKFDINELERWKDIIQNMNVVINQEGIIAQFDGYFDLKELDWEAYRKKYGNIHRLDRILKAENQSADDYKAAKQADTLMTFYVLDDQEVTDILTDLGYKLPEDYIRRNLDYYIRRTSHGSTLSRVVHAYLASVVNDRGMSWQLYQEALTSDYIDIQGGTTGEGIHCGVMGGTISIALNTYAGLNVQGDMLRFSPDLPDRWQSMYFTVAFCGRRYHVAIDRKSISIEVDGSSPVEIEVEGKVYEIKGSLELER